MPLSVDTVETRILIISDTHGEQFPPGQCPDMPVDIVIHCGDLTEESKLSEFEEALKLLHAVQAPLKLVIAGNHDFTLDIPAFDRVLKASALSSQDDEAVVREYGRPGDAEALLSRFSNVMFLREGVHSFVLANGAKFVIYASPYTPSKSAGWGFQYVPRQVDCSTSTPPYPNDGHLWDIPDTIDIAITHGPPYGIFDRTQDAQRTGSHGLFAALEKAKPRLHCFGHIHEGWGAKTVAWRQANTDAEGERSTVPSHLTHIDNDKSDLVESLATLRAGKFTSEEIIQEKRQKLQRYREARVCTASCEDAKGEKTLFVNAAIQGDGEGAEAFHLPWIVTINLPRATE